MRTLYVTALTFCASLNAADFATPEWFAWPTVEPVAGSALDASALNRPLDEKSRISVQGSRFVDGLGQRVRFWGVNLSSNENFPDAEGAVRAARRLAQGGVNIARLHHLDNNWSVDSHGSIWTPNTKDRLQVDAGQRDRLFRLIAELKKAGVYSDLNLKVSRTLSRADGFDSAIEAIPQFQKRVDYFDPKMIQVQKDYARQLLEPVNPYTGLPLAKDPALAMVEINNENSLLGLRTRDIGRALETLPRPFLTELERQWNAWLRKHHADTATLRNAWNSGATPVGASVLPGEAPWVVDTQPGNEVTLEAGSRGSTVSFEVKRCDTVRWRAGVFLGGVAVREGETYTLEFEAKADHERPLQVALGRDEAGWRTDKWRTLGLVRNVDLGTEWRTYRFKFTTHSLVDVGARLALHAGQATGKVWLRGLVLSQGSDSAGLPVNASLEEGTVPVPIDPTPAQWRDWLTFLSDTEVAYVAEMKRFLREELHVTAPIVCTQANYGGIAGLAREKASDFIDSHCYWQHPDFGGPTATWNPTFWTIINTPQLSEFGARWAGEIGGIAQLRVAGKPFTVTEFDNPAPTDFACELYPLWAAFASLQDWDGLFTFDSVGFSEKEEVSKIATFFDQRHHPAKWSFGPFMAKAFRDELIAPLGARRQLHVSGPLFAKFDHVDVAWLRSQPGRDLGFLTHRLEVSETLLPSEDATRVEEVPGASITQVALLEQPHGKVLTVASPHAGVITGFVGESKVSCGPLTVAFRGFGRQFASVTMVAVEGGPLASASRLLITTAARAENRGQQWNAERTSLSDRWGETPTMAEKVPAVYRFSSDKAARVFALAPDGSRAAEVKTSFEAGVLEWSSESGPATLHYEVVR